MITVAQQRGRHPCTLLCVLLTLANIGCSTSPTEWRALSTSADQSQGLDELHIGMIVEATLTSGSKVEGRVDKLSNDGVRIGEQCVYRSELAQLRYHDEGGLEKERTVAAVVLVVLLLGVVAFLVAINALEEVATP